MTSRKPSALILIFFTAFYAQAQLPPVDPAYRLVFHDEFDISFPQTVINDSLWERTPGWNQASNKTGSVTYCFQGDTSQRTWDKAYIIREKRDSSTVKVSGGTCHLLTRKNNYQGEVWNWPEGVWKISYQPFLYTTGALFSRKHFRYGYFELRFRLPPPPNEGLTYKGFGPNFWLFGARPEEGNYYSEIDIFEIDASDNTYTCNAHYLDSPSATIPGEAFFYKKKIRPGVWYTAAAWWTKKSIKFYLDGELIHRFPCGRIGVKPKGLIAMPIFIDVNAPATNFCKNFDSLTQFPYVYELDYVRVYQEKEGQKLRKSLWKRIGGWF